jgi:hypothetical protein
MATDLHSIWARNAHSRECPVLGTTALVTYVSLSGEVSVVTRADPIADPVLSEGNA